jgi:RNA polymerase sigma-70 factor (ECF subfamily)
MGPRVVVDVTGSPGDRNHLVRVLYARYRTPLLQYVLRRVGGDQQIAEDIVQETMVRAWQHADELTPDGARPWLFTVARNLVVSHHHRRRRARPTEVELEAETPIEDEDLDRALSSWQVVEALRQLSDDHRRVLHELFYKRRSVGEVAEELGVPAGTVRSRCFYALRALRSALAERGVNTP